MRLGRPAADLFTLKYQTKHFLSCEVSIKQDSEEKSRAGGIRFTGRKLLRRGQKNCKYKKYDKFVDSCL